MSSPRSRLARRSPPPAVELLPRTQVPCLSCAFFIMAAETARSSWLGLNWTSSLPASDAYRVRPNMPVRKGRLRPESNSCRPPASQWSTVIGNSAVAAQRCGVKKFIGFEIDEEYLAEAKRRVALTVLQKSRTR
jgi:hypothetical protein